MTWFYALHRLSLIEEAGTVSESEVREQVFATMRTGLFCASGLNMGMRRMTAFPYEILKKTTSSARSSASSWGVGPRRRER